MRLNSCFFATVALFANIAGAVRADDDPLFRLVPIGDPAGFELGRGFDLLYGNPRADCVDRTLIQSHPDLGPTSVTFSAVRVEDSQQLDSALGVSASASVTLASWGAGASASFSHSISVSTYDLTFVVSLKVSGKGDSLRDVALKEKYLNLIRDGKESSLARFHEICGDGFIGEQTLGGELQAVIRIHTNSKAEQQSVSTTVSASFSMASGSASFSESLKTLTKTNEVHIQTFRRGGSGSIALTPDELASSAASLPDIIKAAPSPTSAAVFSYITVLDDPTLPVSDFVTREAALNRLAAQSRAARDQLADAQFIADNPSQFFSTPEDLPVLVQEIGELETYIEKIRNRAEDCVKSAGACQALADPLPAASARPARK